MKPHIIRVGNDWMCFNRSRPDWPGYGATPAAAYWNYVWLFGKPT